MSLLCRILGHDWRLVFAWRVRDGACGLEISEGKPGDTLAEIYAQTHGFKRAERVDDECARCRARSPPSVKLSRAFTPR